MKTVAVFAAIAAVALAMPFDVKGNKLAILGGALCQPCIQLIKNGEQNTEGDFDTWFEKEINALCSPLGSLKKLCIQYFKQYENDFNHFIDTKAPPLQSCQEIDFCDSS